MYGQPILVKIRCFVFQKTDNIVDPDAVAIQKDDMVNTPIGGHVPLNYAPIFKRFLSLPNHHIRCRVTGKRVNRGGGFGLEAPVDYIFLGDKKLSNGWPAGFHLSTKRWMNN